MESLTQKKVNKIIITFQSFFFSQLFARAFHTANDFFSKKHSRVQIIEAEQDGDLSPLIRAPWIKGNFPDVVALFQLKMSYLGWRN